MLQAVIGRDGSVEDLKPWFVDISFWAGKSNAPIVEAYFRLFVRQTEPSSAKKTHHCPICGKAVQNLQSFRCTECGKEDFCDSCVASIPIFGTQRFVCLECVNRKGWACPSCGGYAAIVCVNCGKRTCDSHIMELFGLQLQRPNGETYRTDYFNCLTCKGQVCWDCVEERGFLLKEYHCKKCGSNLEHTRQEMR